MISYYTSNSRGAVDREFVYIELENFLLTLLIFLLLRLLLLLLLLFLLLLVLLLLPLLSFFSFSFFFFSFSHAQTRVNLQCGFPRDGIPSTVSALH